MPSVGKRCADVYLLDANACIRILNGSHALLVARLRSTTPHDIRMSAVVKAELSYGALRSARVAENLRLLGEFFAPFLSLPFEDECARHYGQIRADLARIGQPIGPNDLLIAATARAHDLILVTHDRSEFSRVVDLRLEDWEQA